MVDKPIVTASFEREFRTERTVGGRSWTSPGVSLSVTFPLHGHESARRLVQAAYDDVMEQISDTEAGQ